MKKQVLWVCVLNNALKRYMTARPLSKMDGVKNEIFKKNCLKKNVKTIFVRRFFVKHKIIFFKYSLAKYFLSKHTFIKNQNFKKHICQIIISYCQNLYLSKNSCQNQKFQKLVYQILKLPNLRKTFVKSFQSKPNLSKISCQNLTCQKILVKT